MHVITAYFLVSILGNIQYNSLQMLCRVLLLPLPRKHVDTSSPHHFTAASRDNNLRFFEIYRLMLKHVKLWVFLDIDLSKGTRWPVLIHITFVEGSSPVHLV